MVHGKTFLVFIDMNFKTLTISIEYKKNYISMQEYMLYIYHCKIYTELDHSSTARYTNIISSTYPSPQISRFLLLIWSICSERVLASVLNSTSICLHVFFSVDFSIFLYFVYLFYFFLLHNCNWIVWHVSISFNCTLYKRRGRGRGKYMLMIWFSASLATISNTSASCTTINFINEDIFFIAYYLLLFFFFAIELCVWRWAPFES